MDEQSPKKSPQRHDEHREYDWNNRNWRAWGSWFSWGSPIGLSLGYAIIMVSTGLFIWLVAVSHAIRH